MRKNLLLIIALFCAVAQGMWADVVVKNEDELAQAVKTDGAIISLISDFSLSQPITIKAADGSSVTVTINMNGKQLTFPSLMGQTTARCIFIVPKGSVLNLNSGSIADVDNRTGNNTENVAGAIVNNGTATLTGVTISGCKGLLGGAIKNNKGATLNLKSCTFDGNEAAKLDNYTGDCGNGGAIWNNGTVNISKSEDGTYSIKIQNCDAVNGAAIYNDANGVVTMSNDNTDGSIYNNKATADGGAIYNLGSVSLTAKTSVNNNNAANNAGAIWNSGALSLKGCEVSYNKAKNGAAIYTSGSDKSVTINGGSMKANIAYVNGGVIYCDGKVVLDAVTFENNKAQGGDGGAIYVSPSGDVAITDNSGIGNKINNNTATTKGGAIYANGLLAMGSISATANTANAGGMIYIDGGGNVTLNANTSLTENIANTQGGAIYDAGTLAISGKIAVKNNKGASDAVSNVYLPSGKVMNVTGSLSGSNIGVRLENTTGAFTKDFSKKNSDLAPDNVFKTDFQPEFYCVTLSEGEASIALQSPIMISEESVLRQVLNMFDNFSIKLANDINITNSTLEIPSGKTVTIDLAGFTLDRGLKSGAWHTGGQVITVREGATLNLTGGTLTGGYGGNGGAIENSGTANLTDVNITDNRAEHRGGAIANHGTLNMTGGSITNNFSNDTEGSAGGGAIFAHSGSNTTLTGVTITGNQAKVAGGGAINNWGTLTLDGCTIQNNTSKEYGAGVWNGKGSTLNMQGKNTVTDNTRQGKVNNVYLTTGIIINVTGALTGSNIGIQMEDILGTFTTGYKTNNADVDPATVFKADNAVVFIPTLAGEEAALTLQPLISVDNFDDLRQAVQFDGANIQLAGDINSNDILVIGNNKTMTIDLNGKTLNRGLTSLYNGHGQVVVVEEGATLNLSNGTLTGGFGGDGGGLENKGTANLTDVTITGNHADNRGGGISNHRTLTMTGGSITNNVTNDADEVAGGGAIYTYKGSNTTLTGVTITDNKAKIAGGGGVNNWGTVTIDGCTITGNTSSANGGGIWGGPSSTLNMQGKNTITDNQGSGKVNNVYLSEGAVITVTGSLADSQIGISMQKPDTFTSGYSTNNADVAPIQIFLSDDVNYKVILNDNEAKLVKGMTGIESIDNGQLTIDNSWYDMNGRKLNGKPSRAGVYINNGNKVAIK